MRKTALSLLILLAAGTFALQRPPQVNPKPTVPALLEGTKFDNKVVTVVGAVAEFEQRKSRAGNPYFVFKLAEKGKKVNVYGRGTLAKPPKNGDLAQVKGFFRKEKRIKTAQGSDRVYRNEIEVKPTDVKVLTRKK